MPLGVHPQPTAPWRPLIFKVHCVVTQRWMKMRVPFAWFWYGESDYGTPEVEAGTIAAPNPQAPLNMAPRMPRADQTMNPGGELPEDVLVPYQTPKHRVPTPAEEVADLKEELRQLRGNVDQVMRGSDAGRGGR